MVPFVQCAFIKNNSSKLTYITTNQEHQVAQQQEVSYEPVTKEQFLKERRPTHSTTSSPLPTHQSHQLKMRIELPTPRDKLSLKPITSSLRKKSRTTFGSLINDSKEDEERTCSNKIRSRGGKKLEATTT